MNNRDIHPDVATGIPADAAALEANGVTFHYGKNRPAVVNVCAHFRAGELTMIAGPNGSGKSTLLQLLLGHLSPSTGKITVCGHNLPAIHPLDRAALMSYVPQTPQTGFAYCVRELVDMGRWARRQRLAPRPDEKSDDDLIVQAMWDMDVHALADRTFDELSAGERQRVALARALAQDAPIMLLDEPTAALDVWHQLELLQHLKDMAHKKHKAVVWVTHDLNSARANADAVLIMCEGKRFAHGPPQSVLTPEILEPIYRVRVEVQHDQLIFSRFPKPR